jgi:hypothetical protein
VKAHQLTNALQAASERLSLLASVEPEAGLTGRHRKTVTLLETGLRLLQGLPADLDAQLAACEGLSALLNVVDQQAASLQTRLDDRERTCRRIEKLSDCLLRLAAGSAETWTDFLDIAESLWAEARAAVPLCQYRAAPLNGDRYALTHVEPARWVACHALHGAQIVARLVHHDAEWSNRPCDAIAAALVLDAGMLNVDAAAWLHAGPLSIDHRRLVESHVRIGTEMLGRLGSGKSWLERAIAGHHERLDGTGYPGGRTDKEIAPLARLLAVADEYAALTEPRMHRAAFDPRTALAEVLLHAENGLLDRARTEQLLQLSFYPVGTAVELADGSRGVVVATHMSRRDQNTPARPVVLILTDSDGKALPAARHCDLNAVEDGSIVRSLSSVEQQRLLDLR